MGSGPIGLAVLLVLKCFKASKVMVSDPASLRIARAKEAGADMVFNPKDENVVLAVQKATNQRGVDFAYECAGNNMAFDTCLDATAPRGTIMNVSIWETKTNLEMLKMVFREKTLKACITYDPEDFPEVLEAISIGTLDPKCLISNEIGFNDIKSKGFEALIKNPAENVKILVSPDL